jgi:NADH-quinone oxidoreductase subunit J
VSLADVLMMVMFVIGGAASLLVVTSRNVVHAAVYLVVALLTVAGAFLLVGSEFLAWAQVLVYVGAVIILILFGLMLTRAPIGPMAQENELGKALPLAVSGGLFAILVTLIWTSFGGERTSLSPTFGADLGAVLYTDWAFPFMVLGYFLTVALIGAVVVARREEGEGPLPEDAPVEDWEAGEVPPGYSDATPSPGRAAARRAGEPTGTREVRT